MVEYISPKTKIFVVHPGRGRKFYDDFLLNNRAYLEMPLSGLDIDIVKNRENARRAVRCAYAINRVLSGDKDFTIPASLAALDGNPIREKKSLNQMVGSLISLFSLAEPGDIIVTPGSGMYGPVAFGRIEGAYDPQHLLALERYDGYVTPFRKVRWIRTDVQRRQLPKEIVTHVQKPPAVRRVKINSDTVKFFDFAFYSYIYGDMSRALVSAPSYSGRDVYELDPALRFIQFVFAIYGLDEGGNLSAVINNYRNIDDFLVLNRGRESVLRASLNFNSPGHFDLARKSAAFALVFAFLLSTPADSWHADAPAYFQSVADENPEQAGVAADALQRVERFAAVVPSNFTLSVEEDRREAQANLNLNVEDAP